MTAQRRTSPDPPATTGRTWADLAARLPLWAIGLAAVFFVGLLVYASFFAQRSFELGFIGHFGPTVAPDVPSGAVVAFDLRDSCPEDGWERFDVASGRFLVASGGDAATGMRPFRDMEGNLSVTLREPNLPEHRHQTALSALNVDGAGLKTSPWGVATAPHSIRASISEPAGELSTMTSPVGGGEAFEIIPPYIALTFCKKS